ncbi:MULTISPECIES: hypothetical protein [Chromobacterium]|uniref:hypothetical protein n=1 Tax=Chromobacterium TaxID=535 RepID=UPI001F1D224A|nr:MULTISPECIES: hypothetical protein [Chromobacterium]MCS3802703.1 hypothetical protein [Chromobacterium alkanivorans]MCS3817029.1 hypothetical protein [Chromobacterium alkanivorans]MCS3872069.1 hypothetical protein [Chromobacterium alkanivorans]UJB33599.1 hypothetical protein HQN78_22545 [Chromobacterium sp. Beijing]
MKFNFLCLVGVSVFSTAVIAENVPRGSLVVRYGAANTDENYAKEDGYPDGKMQSISAVCSPGNEAVSEVNVKNLIRSDKGHPSADRLGKAGATNASSLIGAGATVVKDPIKSKNPNHCLINNIKLKDIKGVWTIFADPIKSP